MTYLDQLRQVPGAGRVEEAEDGSYDVEVVNGRFYVNISNFDFDPPPAYVATKAIAPHHANVRMETYYDLFRISESDDHQLAR